MNKWLEAAKIVDKHFQRPDFFDYNLKTKCIDAHDTIASPAWSGTVKDYEVLLEMTVRFSCPDGAYEQSLKAAKRTLVKSIYGDLDRHLYSIRAAIMEGDRQKLLEITNHIEQQFSVA